MTPALRSREFARVTRLFGEGGLLLIYGPDAQEASEFVSDALARRTRTHAGTVDADLCASSEELARKITRASADALAGNDRLLDMPEDRRTPAQHKRWLAVRRALGTAFQVLEDSTPRSVMDRDPAQVVSDAIAALARGGTSAAGRRAIVVRGADSMIDVPRSRFKQSSRLLWSMRSAAQGSGGAQIVLTGGPASVELVSAHDAAFRGWGRTLELERLDSPELTAAITAERGVDPAAARRIAELSEGLPRLADRLAGRVVNELEKLPATELVDAMWRGLVRDEASASRVIARVTADLHRVALPVCRALAYGEPPYSVARSTEVTRALRLLYARGLCESPAPRSWRLTDPVLAAWLRGDDTTTGYR
jgi:hypothetical protein